MNGAVMCRFSRDHCSCLASQHHKSNKCAGKQGGPCKSRMLVRTIAQARMTVPPTRAGSGGMRSSHTASAPNSPQPATEEPPSSRPPGKAGQFADKTSNEVQDEPATAAKKLFDDSPDDGDAEKVEGYLPPALRIDEYWSDEPPPLARGKRTGSPLQEGNDARRRKLQPSYNRGNSKKTNSNSWYLWWHASRLLGFLGNADRLQS
jgi:hypothetical protein